MHSERMHKL